jgi:hypothetical protein
MKTAEEKKAAHLTYARNSNRRLRLAAIEAYGGKCACCGEDEEAFLVLDHINDDGHQHRASLGYGRMSTAGAGVPTYRALRQEGWPEGIVQVLCANCNTAKMRGECPHRVGIN